MRLSGWIIAALALATWWASEMPVRPVSRTDAWRRTSNGWEKAAWLAEEAAGDVAEFHPLALVALQLACVMGVQATCRLKTWRLARGTRPVGSAPQPTLAGSRGC